MGSLVCKNYFRSVYSYSCTYPYLKVLHLIVDDESSSPEELEDILLDKLVTITQIVNASRCSIPQMPDQQNIDSVFDTSHEDAQPYLHRVSLDKSVHIFNSFCSSLR